jgi:subtilisin family serine protease
MVQNKPLSGKKSCRNGQRWALVLGCLLCQLTAFGQNARYFIRFTDKNNSPYAVSRPAEFLSQRAIDRRVRQRIAVTVRDLPPNPAYVQAVRQAGARVWYTSRWMNGALLEADEATLGRLRGLPFVVAGSADARVTEALPDETLRNGGPGTPPATPTGRTGQAPDPAAYGPSARQLGMMGVNTMHQLGYTGKDVHIAVLDGGFRNADRLPFFSRLVGERRLLGTYDFVDGEESVFEDEAHGMQVLSALAAYQTNEIVGPAYEAAFWLLRTEDSSGEHRVEEVNWLIGAEFADSVGVHIIQSSLGYNLFDDPAMNYRRRDLDGNTAFVTQAADLAAATGILVVVSAGNEGNDAWRSITAPADGDSVLAVGAVDAEGIRTAFSSVGPSADRRVKPDVSAMGQATVVGLPSGNVGVSNGTSFAAPLVAGLAAGLWQAYPQLTNLEVMDYLRRSGSQAARPDSLLGYGVPHFQRAFDLAARDHGANQPIGYLSPNPVPGETVTLWVNAQAWDKPLTVHVFDVTGKAVAERYIARPARSNQINLGTVFLRQGLYLVRLTSAGRTTMLKLVKQ